jgi:hypothetical protein
MKKDQLTVVSGAYAVWMLYFVLKSITQYRSRQTKSAVKSHSHIKWCKKSYQGGRTSPHKQLCASAVLSDLPDNFIEQANCFLQPQNSMFPVKHPLSNLPIQNPVCPLSAKITKIDRILPFSNSIFFIKHQFIQNQLLYSLLHLINGPFFIKHNHRR